ncbi:MAG: WYL domain-containing protein [Candidatus Edwardsbacteria bacterium]|jgi:proteasome accessory factor C|nr:WYL domain-containing protein [Candidatus Edwardsbacteria bacterium]
MAKSEKEIQRLLTLLAFLNKQKGRPVDQVAAELGTSTAQLLRDLDQLCLYGVPPFGPDDYFLATVDEDNRLEMAYTEQFRAPLHLTPQEAVALRLALLPLLADPAGPYGALVGGILSKLDRALLPEDRRAVDQLDDAIVVAPAERDAIPLMETLRRARRDQRRVEITYYSGSSGEVGRRRIDPYGFVLFGGSWYVVAFCHKHGAVRTFRVSRIKEASLSADGYRVPDDFDIAQYAGGHIFRPTGREQDVELWFSPAVARWILERSALAKRNRDGSATMVLKASNYAWIARWILYYGPEAEIVRPPEARAEIMKILDHRDPS